MIAEASQPTAKWDPASCMLAFGVVPKVSYKDRPIDYTDPAPKPFKVKISLVEYFERVTRHKADKWQRHFCQYLEDAAVNRPTKPTQAIVHAEARLGKSRILAQCYPAWLLGHDPLHRIALATYNIEQSEGHSEAVIAIMNLDIHKEIFPNPDGWVDPGVAKKKWRTSIRKRELTETERSFNAVGLQSGLTGSGFDTLIIDDPYADAKEAYSENTRKNLTKFFWEFTVVSRIGQHSNVFGMFHRYHVEDLAGYLLDKGTFDYLRYASIYDGAYVHESTGQLFPDPLGREIGEYISERRGAAYYRDKQEDKRTWNAMFLGRPSSEEGDFFKINRLIKIEASEIEIERAKCVLWARGWDHAATDGGGDHTAGSLLGMQPDGSVLIDDMQLAQVSSEGRLELQKATAMADGSDVPIVIPQELAEAGKTLVYLTTQYLKGFTVVPRSVTNAAPGSTAKARRAWNFSTAVNAGKVKYASDDHLPEEKKWNDTVIRAMRNFLQSTFDDPIDAMGDTYNYLFEQMTRGLVMRSFSPQRNLLARSVFAGTFGERLPKTWQIYVGVKVTNEENRPNSGIIVARAPEISGLSETLFVLAEYKKYTAEFWDLFTWIDESLSKYCETREATVIALDEDSQPYAPVIRRKLGVHVNIFDEDAMAGIAEANWYMQPRPGSDPFGGASTGLYGVVDDEQIAVPIDAYGLIDFRQEQATWGFNDKGQPTGLGAVLDCLRMTTWNFRTLATPLTLLQKREQSLPEHLQDREAIINSVDQDQAERMMLARQIAFQKLDEKQKQNRQKMSKYRPQVPRVGRGRRI